MTEPRSVTPGMEAFPNMTNWPHPFTWGAATSAYQIEGSPAADGKGPSIWDTFAHTPGRILDGSSGDIACDSYRRTHEDIALLRELGLDAYRFSLSWPRIQPDGVTVNRAGLDHYRRFVDDLLTVGITPWVTLYHWDLPQSLEDAGGWPHRDTAERFGDFTAVVADALGDRVANWITVNEPWCAAFLGYGSGEHAPGRREPLASVAAAHHLLLGHGRAHAALRAIAPDARIGPGLNFYGVHPAGDSPVDHDAVRRIDGIQNRFFADAILSGGYPPDVLADLSALGDLDFIADNDANTIATGADMLCVNYYSRFTVTGESGGATSAAAAPTASGSPWPANEHIGFVSTGRPTTAMGWEIDPDGLRDLLVRLSHDYPGVPLVVSENGAAFDDTPDPTGHVADPQRTDYFRRHLAACRQALDAGAPLHGYFAWSLLDNFEWAWGYTERFGLVSVDFGTGRRTIKDSARWFAAAVAATRS